MWVLQLYSAVQIWFLKDFGLNRQVKKYLSNVLPIDSLHIYTRKKTGKCYVLPRNFNW
jgi:hypothetical protein